MQPVKCHPDTFTPTLDSQAVAETSNGNNHTRKYIDNSSNDLSGDMPKTLAQYKPVMVVKPIAREEHDLESNPCDASKTLSVELSVEQEQAAYTELKKLMGAEVFNRFAVQLSGILYGNAAYRGYGSWLPSQVKPVLCWYDKKEHQENVKTFLNGEFKGSEAAIRLEQFIEMFVIHKDLSLITGICKRQDVGWGAAIFGIVPEHANIYEIWKSRT